MSKRLREWRLSRARAARAEKPAAPPDPIEQFGKEAHDLDAVRKSVEDAAAVSAGFWLSYLFVLFYIGIAAGAVTQKDLLLENPVKLPFLGVDLPLVAFFVLAPILFIVSHAYTLVHFVMLGAKVGAFDTELKTQLGDAPETREGLRRQLPSNIFVQFLAGPGDIREGGLGWLLKAIAWITLVIGPVLLLLLIQAQFLPYHLEWVTWVQRFAIFADVTLLWFMWPAVLDGRSEIKWPPLWRHPFMTLGSLIPIGLAFTAATFPGEWMDENVGNKQWIPPNPVTARLGLKQKDLQDKPVSTSVHDLLFNGEVDDVTRRRKSLFSNTLVLPGFDALEAAKIDDPKKLDSVKQTLVLRGRHLESAVLNSADLRKADLEGAQLQGAWLGRARLQGASLVSAELQGAVLFEAHLQGALLEKAKLQDVLLDGAQLQGASLSSAQLQGAVLTFAELQGASFLEAQLQGAELKSAQLQGASLESAQLQGASLLKAQLQGADFQNANLIGVDMETANIWRARFDASQLHNVLEDGVSEDPMSKGTFAALKSEMRNDLPEDFLRETTLKRIEFLNPDVFGPEANNRDLLEHARVDETAYKESLADQLKSLACSSNENAPYVVRSLIANFRIRETGAQAPGLVEAILKPDCPVSASLTDADKAALKETEKLFIGAH